ncbi:hypothetical protein [Metapseudomonas resinovorans]|uniref:Uncharacterized protein n=1 Tax=Metapseudomonas resinovorans NBRC 106553 TaxID=1245471 RepID=S6ALF1_METRE|nr:hypothetical protein [Pseudomonas resinovorans]BAN49580.1 hypothetical protein PCA10_38480 [Pseudomonas resinovorans NBRC 106553]
MLSLDVNNSVARLSEAVRRQVAAKERGDEPEDRATVLQGIRVSLSDLGKAGKPQKNDDIDESSLPDRIKELLKMIRELKAQIAERKAELQAIASDPGLDEETRRQRLEAVQGQLASLQGALGSANANLVKAVRDANLSQEQAGELGKLLAG